MKSGNLNSHALNGNWAKNLYFLEIDVDADATAGISVLAPWKLEIVDAFVQCRAANASGTLTVRTSTSVISSALVCAVDTTLARTTIIDIANSIIAKNGDINAISIGGTTADTRGLVTLVCKRLGD